MKSATILSGIHRNFINSSPSQYVLIVAPKHPRLQAKNIILAILSKIRYNDRKECEKRLNIEVHYKNKKRYQPTRYPMRQSKFWSGLIWLLSRIMLTGKTYQVEKIHMEGLKPPYMLLHGYFIISILPICRTAY